MPKHIAYYVCNYCRRQYDTHDEAQKCEDSCEKFSYCTICHNTCHPAQLKRRTDASNKEHRICPDCYDVITATSWR